MPVEVSVSKDADNLAAEAAERILRSAQEAIRARGRFHLALAGGSTPERTYRLLAKPENASRLDPAHVSIYFGDERMVPHDDPRSNFGMAKRSLLDHVAFGAVHPVPTDRPPAESAASYARTLAESFGIPLDGPPPRFDLILLGLGDDGHTASLFPGKPTLDETRAWVTWSTPGVLPPPVDRVTLTFPVLNAAREVLFLVSGAGKAATVKDVLEGSPAVRERPSAGVRPTDGTLTWLLDADAARLLTPAKR